MKGKLIRDVTRSECPWLKCEFRQGDTVFRCEHYDFKSITNLGVFCTLEDNGSYPGFELPKNAVVWENSMPTIDNWSVVSTLWTGHARDPNTSEFIVAENGFACLHGVITGHWDMEDGHRGLTSPITQILMNEVTTRSGSVYKLGTMNPNYEEFLVSIGMKFPASLKKSFEVGI